MLYLIVLIPACVGSFCFVWLIFFSGFLRFIFSWSDSISYFLTRIGHFPLSLLGLLPYWLPISVISIFVMVVLISWGGPDDSGWGRE